MSSKKLSIVLLGFLFVLSVLHFFSASISKEVLISLRWLFCGLLMYYGWQRKSLTIWILIAMVIGAEIGYDFPSVGKELQVLSKVFLKLIKSIIAPLLFGTLVLGIAGHADIKQVGRMGWKSLLYFEIVTTIALFIGLAAINISKAGYGLVPPAEMNDEILPATSQTWRDIILHIFPENLAKSVVEGQVLQIVVFSILLGIALALVNERMRKPMLDFCESLSEVMFKFTSIINYVFCPYRCRRSDGLYC